MGKYIFGIKCKECGSRWNLNVEMGFNRMKSIAAICTCGNIFAGQLNCDKVIKVFGSREIVFHDKIEENLMKSILLTNGSFQPINEDAKKSNYATLLSEE